VSNLFQGKVEKLALAGISATLSVHYISLFVEKPELKILRNRRLGGHESNM
jgi:hypothetical protein